MDRLPDRILQLQPAGWPIVDGTLLPYNTRWLSFAIHRALLGRWALESAWQWNGDHQAPLPDPDCGACLVPAPGRLGVRRRLTAKGRSRHPGRPPAGLDEDRRLDAKALQGVRLPQWLVGGVLAWRKDRWAFAPRLPSGQERRKAARQVRQAQEDFELQQQQAQHADYDAPTDDLDQARDRLWEAQQRHAALSSPFTDASHLLACINLPRGQHATMACHYKCPGPATARARCLNHQHLAWGNAACNSYHKVVHDRGEEPHRRRPGNFVSPSREEGYDRHRPPGEVCHRHAAAGSHNCCVCAISAHLPIYPDVPPHHLHVCACVCSPQLLHHCSDTCCSDSLLQVPQALACVLEGQRSLLSPSPLCCRACRPAVTALELELVLVVVVLLQPSVRCI